MKKCNKELKLEFKVGLLTFALYLVLYRFTDVHELILGLLFGISMSAYIKGLMPQSILAKIKLFKRSLLGMK
ncbi:hypothetical protein PV797_20170 [Clostridiaceae bacterium M8S5]|nr:hypothetical protein PV797_20170 [Clostridiaceae bacterium M8S5]